MSKEVPESVVPERRQARTSLPDLLKAPLKGLRARMKAALIVAAIMPTFSLETGPLDFEDISPKTVKCPPKPGEDDGIYSEATARAQSLDF